MDRNEMGGLEWIHGRIGMGGIGWIHGMDGC